MATILPLAETQFNDALGVPLAGGTVTFYMPNTSTFKDTFQDSLQTITNQNPVPLDSAGRAIIFGSGAYRQVVKDANGNLIWDQTTSEAVVGQTSFGGTSTGSANAQVVAAGTFSGADGSVINFTAGFTNTGSMTVAVGSGGAPIAVLKNGPSGPVNLASGDIAAGNVYSIAYSVSLGTFQLLQSIPPVITIASQAEAIAGTNNTNVMTPLRVSQAYFSHVPSVTVDKTVPRFSGTGGNTQTSLVTISDAGALAAPSVFEGTTKLDSRGLAKAWVSFNGATGPTILASYNVSSVTRNGAGDYTVNFTSAFANTNYAVVGSCEVESSFPNEVRAVSVRNGGRATGSTRVKTGLTGSNTFDLPGVFLAFFSN